MTPEQQAKSMLEGHGPTLEKIAGSWRLTLGGDPASNKGEYSAVGSDPVRLAENALAWLGKGKGIVREEPSTVSGEPQHGAAPVVPSLPEPPSEPEVIERVVHQDTPETLAKLADLERELTQVRAKLDRKPEQGVPPADIADLIIMHETPAETFERLTRLYNDAKQKAYLALNRDGTFEGLSAVGWEKKAERYESGLKWNRGRLAGTI